LRSLLSALAEKSSKVSPRWTLKICAVELSPAESSVMISAIAAIS
jgi:hypothetical protein